MIRRKNIKLRSARLILGCLLLAQLSETLSFAQSGLPKVDNLLDQITETPSIATPSKATESTPEKPAVTIIKPTLPDATESTPSNATEDILLPDEIPECDCFLDSIKDLYLHDETCARKSSSTLLADSYTADELLVIWHILDSDVKDYILYYLNSSDQDKYISLKKVLEKAETLQDLSIEKILELWNSYSPEQKNILLTLLMENEELYLAFNELRFPNISEEIRTVIAAYANKAETLPVHDIQQFYRAKQELDWAWGTYHVDSPDRPEKEEQLYYRAAYILDQKLNHSFDYSISSDSNAEYVESPSDAIYSDDIFELTDATDTGYPDIEFLDSDCDPESLKEEMNEMILDLTYQYYDAADQFSDEDSFIEYLEEYAPEAAAAYEILNPYAEYEMDTFSPTLLGDVYGEPTPEIEVNLFNYGSNIQSVGGLAFKAAGGDKELESTSPQATQNKPVFKTLRTEDDVEDIENGYPYVDYWYPKSDNISGAGSWQYLFEKSDDYYLAGTDKNGNPGLDATEYAPQATNYAVKRFPVDNLNLFTYDEENRRYTYDSRYNAAIYDASDNSLTSYDYAIRCFQVGAVATGQGTFMPFNSVWENASNVMRLTDENANILSYSSSQWPSNMSKIAESNIKNAELCALVPNLYALNGGANNKTDLAFGMSMEFDFIMPADGLVNNNEMIFDFRGDDDLVVFIDGKCVLNLGGPRAVTRGTINFKTGKVTVYTSNKLNSVAADDGIGRNTTLKSVFSLPNDTFEPYTLHNLKMYYMERYGDASNCYMDFNIPVIPAKSLTVTKELAVSSNNELNEYLQNSLSYQFRAMRSDENGNSTGEFFIQPGMEFELQEDGIKIGTGTVERDGTFKLKAGQSAQFKDIISIVDEDIPYIVQEIMPDNLTGQYADVEYEVGGTIGSIMTIDGPTEDFTTYQTSKLSALETNGVVFRNKVDVAALGDMKITKEAEYGSRFTSDDIFAMHVTLGDDPIAVGTPYTIGNSTKTVTYEGIIPLKIGETAMITGILSGTDYEVKEITSLPNTAAGTITNVARGKSSTAYNTVNGTNSRPGLLTDGNKTNPSNYWDGGKIQTGGSGFTIDLEGLHRLSGFSAYPYWGDGRSYQYKILTSRDNITFTQVAEKTDLISSSASGEHYELDEPIDARYVRVVVTGNSQNNIAHMVEFEVKGFEIPAFTSNFMETYSGTVTPEKDDHPIIISENSIKGSFPLEGHVDITVTNTDYDVMAELKIRKKCLRNINDELFKIIATQINEDTHEPITIVRTFNADVLNENWKDVNAIIPYRDAQPGTYYYRFDVDQDSRDIFFDDTFYIVAIRVDSNGTEVISIKKNGTEELGPNASLDFISEKIIRSIEGTVWYDEIHDNVLSESDTLLNGLDITLYHLKDGGDPSKKEDFIPYFFEGTMIPVKIQSGTSINVSPDGSSAPTAYESGKYLFTHLPAGTYMIVIENGAEDISYMRTVTANFGDDDTIDSEAEAIYIRNGSETSDGTGILTKGYIKPIILPSKQELSEAIYETAYHNAGFVKLLTDLTVHKEIDQHYEPYGTAAFLFEITGYDIYGREQSWYRSIQLDTDTLSGSFTINDIPPSDASGYLVRELTTARYKVSEIQSTNSMAGSLNLGERSIRADLNQYDHAVITFKNLLNHWNGWSHKDYRINQINISKTM